MLTCKDASRLVSEGQDRNLSLLEGAGLRLHLWMCDNCQRFERQISYLRQTLRSGLARGDLPLEKQLPAEAQARIRQALKEHTGNGDG